MAVTITLAERRAGGHLGHPAPVVLCLDEPHRIEIDDGHDGAEIAGASGDALAHRPEPDHDDLAPVRRQTRDRREGRPRLDADVVTVVDQVLERDPVPVEHRERDLQSVESVQPGGRRLKRSGRPVAGSSSGGDQVAAHVAQRIGRFADEPRQRLVELAGAHPGMRPDLDADRCQVGDGAIVGAVGGLHGASRTRAPASTNGATMQIVSARMCWRQATVRPLKSEAVSAAPNEVVIGVVHAIHSSSAASITQVHQFPTTPAGLQDGVSVMRGGAHVPPAFPRG